ncbi:MAG: hydroxymethylbilane synthase [Luteolibacter sp.]|uniref:hydroxymethylbilane synthase n=1 Tax=Luteolibacter sp. TaxID=1962973 RepID=UPI0032630BA1
MERGLRDMTPDESEMTDESPAPILVGTRGSELALVQATATESALAAAFPERKFVRKVITTTGDRRTDVSLADVAKAEGTFDKGVFIKEIEEALDAGEIDIAVHSLKDLPTVLEDRFTLAAVLERAPVRDVLVMREPGGLAALPVGAKVGTSSVRRAKQIEWLRPDVTVIDLRGNVPTRLRKLAEGETYDAILLAEAGLVRLDFIPQNPIGNAAEEVNCIPGIFVTRLEESEFFPAAGQGAIGLEVRAGDAPSRVFAETIGHRDTWLRITAEREFLRLLDGGCHTPVGVYSSISDGEIHLKARVFPEAGGTPKSGEARGTDPISIALELFNSLS